MPRILRHRPERDGDVVPEIGGAGHAEIPLPGLFPVPGNSALFIGGDHFPADLHRLRIEVILLSDRGEPDVLRAVLPVPQGSASFFPLPGDAVPDRQKFSGGRIERCGAPPVAAEIHRRLRLQHPEQNLQTAFNILLIRTILHPCELQSVEIFCQIVRWIQNQQIRRALRQKRSNLEQIPGEHPVDDLLRGERGTRGTQQTLQPDSFLSGKRERPVAFGFLGSHHFSPNTIIPVSFSRSNTSGM